jgi:hypothetical protein
VSIHSQQQAEGQMHRVVGHPATRTELSTRSLSCAHLTECCFTIPKSSASNDIWESDMLRPMLGGTAYAAVDWVFASHRVVVTDLTS